MLELYLFYNLFCCSNQTTNYKYCKYISVIRLQSVINIQKKNIFDINISLTRFEKSYNQLLKFINRSMNSFYSEIWKL